MHNFQVDLIAAILNLSEHFAVLLKLVGQTRQLVSDEKFRAIIELLNFMVKKSSNILNVIQLVAHVGLEGSQPRLLNFHGFFSLSELVSDELLNFWHVLSD